MVVYTIYLIALSFNRACAGTIGTAGAAQPGPLAVGATQLAHQTLQELAQHWNGGLRFVHRRLVEILESPALTRPVTFVPSGERVACVEQHILDLMEKISSLRLALTDIDKP